MAFEALEAQLQVKCLSEFKFSIFQYSGQGERTVENLCVSVWIQQGMVSVSL